MNRYNPLWRLILFLNVFCYSSLCLQRLLFCCLFPFLLGFYRLYVWFIDNSTCCYYWNVVIFLSENKLFHVWFVSIGGDTDKTDLSTFQFFSLSLSKNPLANIFVFSLYYFIISLFELCFIFQFSWPDNKQLTVCICSIAAFVLSYTWCADDNIYDNSTLSKTSFVLFILVFFCLIFFVFILSYTMCNAN